MSPPRGVAAIGAVPIEALAVALPPLAAAAVSWFAYLLRMRVFGTRLALARRELDEFEGKEAARLAEATRTATLMEAIWPPADGLKSFGTGI